jgi:hypothetical protein
MGKKREAGYKKNGNNYQTKKGLKEEKLLRKLTKQQTGDKMKL